LKTSGSRQKSELADRLLFVLTLLFIGCCRRAREQQQMDTYTVAWTGISFSWVEGESPSSYGGADIGSPWRES